MKKALITGGSKRIGKEITLSLVKENYFVYIHYHQSKTEAEAIQKQYPNQISLIQADLSIPNKAPTLFEKIDTLDLLINNASSFEGNTIQNATLEELQENFSIHVFSPFLLIQSFAKKFKKGHIINISDINIKQNKAIFAPYLLSKKSLNQLTKLAASELSPEIRVNEIAPGWILDPLIKTEFNMDLKLKEIPLNKKGNPSDISQAIHFLEKNTYLTGQVIEVAGGCNL